MTRSSIFALSTAMLLAITASMAHAQTSPVQWHAKAPIPMSISPEGIALNNVVATAPAIQASGDQHGTTGSAQRTTPNPTDASDQPEMATGADLNGPPTRFPAREAPE